MDLGYSPDNAERMTEFTIRYSAEPEEDNGERLRELTRGVYENAYKRKIISSGELESSLVAMGYVNEDAELIVSILDYDIEMRRKPIRESDYIERSNKIILSGYRRGLYDRDEAVGLLTVTNYSVVEANMEIALINYEREESIKMAVLDAVKQQYADYIIDNVKLHEILNSFAFQPGEIATIESELNLAKSLRSRSPSLSDIKKFYSLGIIGIEELFNELRGLGYHEKYVGWYVASITG